MGGVPGALVPQSDVVRKRLFGIDPESRLPDSAYSPALSRRVYAALRDSARSALSAGAIVFVDAVHARVEERRATEPVATEAGASFAGFWLHAPRQTLRNRVARRGRDVSDATIDVVEQQDRLAVGEVSWRTFDSRCET